MCPSSARHRKDTEIARGQFYHNQCEVEKGILDGNKVRDMRSNG
jgi:hypothetical protein